MKIKLFITTILLTSQFTYAKNSNEPSIDFDGQAIPKDLIYNKRYLELVKKKDTIREVRKKDIIIDKEFHDLNNISIATKPSTRLLKNIDEIYMHSQFPISLVLPQDIKVTFVKAFPETIKPTKTLNIIDIEPTNNLLTSTLQIKYLKDGVPGIMTIIVNRYNKELAINKKDYTLYPIINYINFTPLEPSKVVELYRLKNKNKSPIDNSSVVINKVVYRFVEDYVNGYLTVDNRKFLLEYSYEN